MTLRKCLGLKRLGSGVAILATLTAFAGSAAADNCRRYAITAAKQQQTNESKGCNFSGPNWTKDLKVHEAFCASVAPTVWRAELAKRQRQLEQCKG